MYACRWFPDIIQMAPKVAVTITPLIYPANNIWLDGRPRLIWCCGSFPINLTLPESTQLHSRTMLSHRTNPGAGEWC